MRKKIAAGNWKMNLLINEVDQFIQDMPSVNQTAEVIIGAPSIYIERLLSLQQKGIKIASQDVSIHEKGAYTGEISAPMLKAIGVNAAIVGHSERRMYHHESDELIGLKVQRCLENQITPIYCCGETLTQRQANEQEKVVGQQILTALSDLSAEQMKSVVIAYEPVWAIGTGVTASNDQAEEMHAFIRKSISEQWNDEVAQGIRILYGGSVNPHNADGLFACPNVDGGLVGGASLKVNDFVSIINSAAQ
jgi:triosephosphate isomerase